MKPNFFAGFWKTLALVVVMLTAGLTAQAATMYYTYYFNNSGNWSNVLLYSWSSVNGFTQATYDSTLGLWCASTPDTSYKWTSDTGWSKQSAADLSGGNGSVYSGTSSSTSGTVGSGSYYYQFSDLPALTDGVYVLNAKGASAIYVYSYSSEAHGDWPGAAMTQYENTNYWYWDGTLSTTPGSVMFTDNSTFQSASEPSYVKSGVYDTSGNWLGIATGTSGPSVTDTDTSKVTSYTYYVCDSSGADLATFSGSGSTMTASLSPSGDWQSMAVKMVTTTVTTTTYTYSDGTTSTSTDTEESTTYYHHGGSSGVNISGDGTSYSLSASSSISSSSVWYIISAGSYTVTLNLSGNTPSSFVLTSGSTGSTGSTASPFYLQINNGSGWSSYAMTYENDDDSNSDDDYYIYTITLSEGAYFTFSPNDDATSWSSGNGRWYAGNSGDVTISADGEYTATTVGTSVFTVSETSVYKFIVYTSEMGSYKFHISGFHSYAEGTIFYGSTIRRNGTAPSTPIEPENGVYPPITILVNEAGSNGTYFRFSTKNGGTSASDGWCGPASSDYTYDFSSTKAITQTTTSSSQVYKFNQTGNYVLQVNSVSGSTVNFTLTRTGDYHKPYYFSGDVNEWFNSQFSGDYATKYDMFYGERDDWEFTYIDADYYAAHANSMKSWPTAVLNELGLTYSNDSLSGTLSNSNDWYVFENFPEEKFSGQWQIVYPSLSSSEEDFIWHDEHYGSAYSGSDQYDYQYKGKITKDDIEDKASLSGKMQQVTGNYSLNNFHLGCNAVLDAKIFFKPGSTGSCDMIVTGTPKDYFVFYAKVPEAGDNGYNTYPVAKINSENPNTINYYLPGLKVNGSVLYSTDMESGTSTSTHMNLNGVTLTAIPMKDKDAEEIMTAAVEAGLDSDDATSLAGYRLPNGRTIDTEIEYVYVSKIPNGFEYPAGGKYVLYLTAAPKAEDVYSSSNTQAYRTINNNHVYYVDYASDGVYVVLDKSHYEWAVGSDHYVKAYYRVYAQDANYNYIVYKFANHDASSFDYVTINTNGSIPSSTKNTTGNALNYGWIEFSDLLGSDNSDADDFAHIYNSNVTIWEDYKASEYTWYGNLGTATSDGEEYTALHKIPQTQADKGYIQIRLEAYDSNDKLVATHYIPQAPTLEDTYEHFEISSKIEEVTKTSASARKKASSNSVDYVVYLNTGGYYEIGTGIEEILEEIAEAETAESDATPVYYNLQGVRVNNPGKGLYIEVKGSKTRKVMF